MLGIFDSGIGGLSLVRKLLDIGFSDFIYLKDSSHFPYGLKTKEELFELGKNDINFLLNKGADKIIIACHTMSNAASDKLKSHFKDNLVLDVLNPTLNFLENSIYDNILILGTNTTIDLGIYKNRLKKKINFTENKSSDLVEAIENNNKNKIRNLIDYKTKVSSHKNENIKGVLLACTHFSLIKNDFKKYSNIKSIIDPIDILFEHIIKKGQINLRVDNKNNKSPIYYTT